ncbi:MupA/Atu3671 family FMN-dependent luciferase-like monooxygenase [Acanthopleuribacter pedis]|uniref:LLM class flavin-dependent oxidoreductase n=1 Tax=Acanthopleuribacter pedis TaxID=442870 RepID=A0A8J7Q9R3_9BACT|nr:MupA/Atu3671 family FMN-dependent luciferase-like monooxygenase [Acanthopleuribacter pedis]MBO1319579.1 LLM class flavin-dependent oxidoreductase [Acanthopleuribacter pedis]
MTEGNGFSCYIIGQNRLLTECAEILIKKGHQIRGIISATDAIIGWAQHHDIPVLDPKSDYGKTLAEDPYDYFFSITHLSMLPDEILQTPQKAAINFHDGPLPDYAGLNTPAWALLNGEERYGITWHLITSGVDTGDILKQQLFDVVPRETSLSINTKCFEAAMESFGELVDELTDDRTTATPQDPTGRKEFRRSDRPPLACYIDWNQEGQAIENFVRALFFGPYENPLGSPKIAKDGKVFMVTRARTGEEDADEDPGTIASISDDRIDVCAEDVVVSLMGFTRHCGQEVPVSQVVEELGLDEGDQLTVFEGDQGQALTDLAAKLAKAEPAQVRRLSRLEPIEIPYATTEKAGEEADLGQAPIAVPTSFRDRFGSEGLSDALVAACAAYLSRIGGKDRFHVAFSDPGLAAEHALDPKVIAPRTTLLLKFAPNQGFAEALSTTQKELARGRKRGSWLNDIMGRYPEVHQQPGLVSGKLLPVAIEIGATGQSVPAPGTQLTFSITPDGDACTCIYDRNLLSSNAVDMLQRQFAHFLDNAAADADRALAELDILSGDERRQILETFNQTGHDFDRSPCIHTLFEAQVAKTPDDIAVVFEAEEVSYAELNQRANQLAHFLIERGIGPDTLVGISVSRSVDLIVAIMGTLKAGGAYVPLDPDYPSDRLAYMIEDAKIKLLITQDHLVDVLPEHRVPTTRIDADWPIISQSSGENPDSGVTPAHMSYVIYTSGSTGKPKGVMVEHRNVVNFFEGMDDRIPHEGGGTWLAVTSLSFDISVLELFWTLARGFKLVVFLDRTRNAAPVSAKIAGKGMEFGLFYWGNDDGPGRQKYHLLLEGAKFADTNGFQSVWTPERHFHAFGGPYPNPSVTGAAVAAVTKRISVRSGSCVLPLHNPIRVAEEWAVIDNLSEGRAALAVASGWQPDDFILQPQNYENFKAKMFDSIETLKQLWRGETVAFPGVLGKDVEIVTQPRPVQKELPIWITTAGNPDTYRRAARIGANILTHLLGQSVEEVAEKIRIYRDELKACGRDPKSGKVTLMLHTFVGDDNDVVFEKVRAPMKEYLGSSVSLVKNYAWAFPAFKRPEGEENKGLDDIDLGGLDDAEMDGVLEFAFERYFETSGLFGTVDRCIDMVNKLKEIGVDEIAALIDFGIPTEDVLASLPLLKEVRERSNETIGSDGADYSLAAQISRHKVTHMQCTPSMARMMLMNDEAREAIGGLQHMMVGGEAFPPALAEDLTSLVQNSVTNMYGPTETTIWSSTQQVAANMDSIPIGKPLANTQLYVLDIHGQPVPAGVPGELFIGGEGVVRGYLDRPELTAERFVKNPFVADADARMYRTGDLAKWREDGVMAFIGRVDHQVKIRGYRIELGEIEAVLNSHDGVVEGVVIAREDNPGDQRLVAYYTSHEPAPDEETLRDLMRSKLPDYMVPSNFVEMDALPHTPNKKIDRKALPAPEALVKKSQAEFVAPESELESQIAEIWQETLNVDQVGVEDNFFDIGGHSLLVVRMHRTMRERLSDHTIALTDLYRFPTIKALVNFLNSDGVSENVAKSADRAARRRERMQQRRRRRR